MTEETKKKFDEEQDLLNKVKILLDEAKEPEVLYNRLEQEVAVVKDIALVQCFYGTDIARIRATTQAIEFNLQMTRKPSTWVFVEAQKSKSDCAFGWLRKHGVKYIFVKTTSDSDGILLKNPLWNIGAENCQENRLCFLDSDVVMCNSDWVEKCHLAFDSGLDVMSLAANQYCQGDVSCELRRSIGHMWNTQKSVEGSHCGFSVGMTRKVWREIGKLKPAVILDDLRTFHEIVGQSAFAPFARWTSSFKLDNRHALGYNLELGSTDNIACHIWHGDPGKKYEFATDLLAIAGVKDVDDLFDVDKKTGLPTWKSGIAYIDAIKCVLKDMDNIDDPRKAYYREMRNRLGTPNEKYPLFVCTVVKDCFGLEFKDFVSFKMGIEGAYNPGHGMTPTVVFITDCTKFKSDFVESNINVMPLDNKIIDGKAKTQNIVDMCAASVRAVEKGKWRGSTVMYVPFDFKDFDKLELDVWIPDGVVKLGDGVEMVKV